MSGDGRWRAVDKDIEIYKFYLDITLKATAFVLAITGGLASYYFAQEEKPLLSLSLALPLIMNAGFAFLYRKSVPVADTIWAVHRSHCLSVGIRPYNLGPLPALLKICFWIHAVVCAGLVIVLALAAL